MNLLLGLHVLISLLGILSGFVVVLGFIQAKSLEGWNRVFLATTVATSVSGFLLPAKHLMPSHVVGMLSLVVLALALYARYGRHLDGPWRRTYVVTAVLAQYFNVFVLVVQSFLKVPALNALVPKGSEPPFAIAQVAVLVLFVVLGIAAAIRFKPAQSG